MAWWLTLSTNELVGTTFRTRSLESDEDLQRIARWRAETRVFRQHVAAVQCQTRASRASLCLSSTNRASIQQQHPCSGKVLGSHSQPSWARSVYSARWLALPFIVVNVVICKTHLSEGTTVKRTGSTPRTERLACRAVRASDMDFLGHLNNVANFDSFLFGATGPQPARPCQVK